MPIPVAVEALPTPSLTRALGRVKGLSIVELAKGIRREYGADALARMVAALPAPFRHGLRADLENLGILAGTWYPIEILNSLYDQLAADLSAAEQHRLAQTIGKEYVDRLLRGIYRFIFESLMTPERYVAHAQRLWDQGCDTGKLELTQVSPQRVDGRILDWPGHHPLGCEVAHHIGVHIYLAMGCRGVKSRYQCKAQSGADACTGSYFWSGRR